MGFKRKEMITIGVDSEIKELLEEIQNEHGEMSLSLSAAGGYLMKLGRDKYFEMNKTKKSEAYQLALDAVRKLPKQEIVALREELF